MGGFPWLAWLAGIPLPGWLAGLASLGKRAENFFEEKACTRRKSRFYVYQRGENRRAKQTNERKEMTTAEPDTAELLAAEERAFTAKRAAWASVIFARTEEELDRATSAYQQATVAYSQAHTAWYDAARAANLLR